MQKERAMLTADLEALEDTLRSILQSGVEPHDAWRLFQPHAELFVERAGGLKDLAEDSIGKMLAKHDVSRWG